MTAFTLAGAAISWAIVRLPRFGVPTATVSVASELSLAAGDQVELVIGDLVMACAVVAGGTFAAQSTYQLAGGAGRWAEDVPAREHRSDGGITVAEVAADLATDAGELGMVVEAGAERPLGGSWVRRAGLASDALAQLAGEAWWVAADGWTHVGPRPASTISPSTLRILAYEPALRRATVALGDDAVAQLVPGVTLADPSLPAPLEIGAVTIRVDSNQVEVDLLGERPPSEMLSALLALVAARARQAAPALYQVDEDAQNRSTLRAAGPAAVALSAQTWIDRGFGVPGVTAELAPGQLVLVQLVDGSPGAPRVLGYLPGALPLSLAFDAVNGVTVGAGATDITLGGPAAKRAAIAEIVDTNMGAVVGKLNAICTLLGIPLLPSAVTCAAQKVNVE